MITYDVGPDSPYYSYDFNEDSYLWIVTHYTDHGYDGSGSAVALAKDGKLHSWCLSHCSCYGPFEESPDVSSVEDWLGDEESIHSNEEDIALETKVKELLGLT